MNAALAATRTPHRCFVVSTIQEIEQAALRLSEEDRLKLADRLLGSLPGSPRALAPEETLAEVIKRDAELENGVVQPLSDDEFWHGIRRHTK